MGKWSLPGALEAMDPHTIRQEKKGFVDKGGLKLIGAHLDFFKK